MQFTFESFAVISFVVAEPKSGMMYWKIFNEDFPCGVKESIITEDGKEIFKGEKPKVFFQDPTRDSLVCAEDLLPNYL